jgi:FdhE protein
VRNPVAPDPRTEPAFERRAARADALARVSVTAAEPLRFAAGLYRAQGRLAAALEALHAERPLSGRLRDDAGRFGDHLGELLRFAAAQGPPGLAAEAEARAREETSLVQLRLLAWWSGELAGGEDYLSRAILRPYGEVLAALAVSPDRIHRPGHCPFCGGAPWIALRRSEPGADGARRLLGCALCGGEWLLGRIRCPACAQEDPEMLPSFSSDAYPAVRIEACEACRRYVKSIDLTIDARAIPEVDDLVSLSMDLWAAREGFTRIEPGLAGMITGAAS